MALHGPKNSSRARRRDLQDVEGEAGGHAAVLDAYFEGAGAGVGWIESAQASAPVAEQVAGGIVTRGGGEDGEADGERLLARARW